MRSVTTICSGCKTKFYSTQLLVLSAILFVFLLILLSSQLSAAPVLNESTLNAGTAGVTVGSFDGGGTGLFTIANLPDTSAANRNFVSQTFTPSVTGTYIFGISNSNEDTVLILYDTSFDPLNPTANSIVLNDDSDGLGAGGVVMARCGANARLCPRITANLEGGKTFQIVITSFEPAKTVSDGVSFYIFGEPVIVGNIEDIAEDPIVVEAAEEITQAVELDLKNIIQNFMKNERDQIEGAVQRHIVRADRQRTNQTGFNQPIVSNTEPRTLLDYDSSKLEFASKTTRNKPISNDLKQFVVSNTEPRTLLVYDSSKLEFASKTTKNKPISHDTDLIISQNFYYFKTDNENLSKNANINIALERLLTKRSTLGASLGYQYNKTRFKFPERADNNHSSVSLGIYGVTSAAKNLIFAWHSAFLFGKGEVSSDVPPVQWKSNYDTEGVTAGISTTGKVQTKLRSTLRNFGKVEIWPKINFKYGSVKSTSLHSRVTIGSISDSIIVSSEPVKVMEASFSPDFKIKIKGGQLLLLADILTISPVARCQIIDASSNSHICGTQLGIYLSRQNDGMKRAEIQLEKSSLGKGGSFWAGLRLPF